MHVVYCHTNLINGKCYVGVTPMTAKIVPENVSEQEFAIDLMNKRFARHVYDATSRNLPYAFHSAIRLHGKDNFTHKILEICDSLEDAFKKEIQFIIDLKSRTSENGYNIKPGGEGCAPSVSANKRKSEGLKKRWAVSGAKEKHSQVMKSVAKRSGSKEKLSNIMKVVSNRPEEKARRSVIARTKFSKSVVQICAKTNQEIKKFSSLKEASEHTSIRSVYISRCARGIIHEINGFKWKFVNN